MEILKKIDDLLIGWGISPSRADMFDQFIAFALILAVAFLADALCRKILLKVVAQLVKKTKATWDDIVFDRKVMVHLSRMVAPVSSICLFHWHLSKSVHRQWISSGVSALFTSSLLS